MFAKKETKNRFRRLGLVTVATVGTVVATTQSADAAVVHSDTLNEDFSFATNPESLNIDLDNDGNNDIRVDSLNPNSFNFLVNIPKKL